MSRFIIIISLSLFLTSCVQPIDCPSGHPMVKGTVRDYTGLDGCGFVIELKSGERLEPALVHDSTFVFHDNQKVWLSYKPYPNAMSICMVGEIVEVLCIKER